MLKDLIEAEKVRVELRCERSAAFDINRKHKDIIRLFYGESISLQVIFSFTDLSTAPFLRNLAISVDHITTEKTSSLGYSKLGTSLMKIKSVESLTEHVLGSESLLASMDNLVDVHTPSIIHEVDDLLVYNLPITIPDYLEDDDGDSLVGVPTLSKRIRISVSVYEKQSTVVSLNSILEKTEAFGSQALRSLIQSSMKDDDGLAQSVLACQLSKVLDLVNPLNISINLQPGHEANTLFISSELSPTQNIHGKLNLDSYVLGMATDQSSVLVRQAVQIESFAEERAYYPIDLEAEDVFAFSHLARLLDPAALRAMNNLRLTAKIQGLYEGKKITIDLERPIDPEEFLPQIDDCALSLTGSCTNDTVLINEPFTVEFTLRNNTSETLDLLVSFPLPTEPARIVSLDPEFSFRQMAPRSIRSFYVKFLPLASGKHNLDMMRITNMLDNSLFQVASPLEVHVLNK